MVAQNANLRNHSCAKCIFSQPKLRKFYQICKKIHVEAPHMEAPHVDAPHIWTTMVARGGSTCGASTYVEAPHVVAPHMWSLHMEFLAILNRFARSNRIHKNRIHYQHISSAKQFQLKFKKNSKLCRLRHLSIFR